MWVKLGEDYLNLDHVARVRFSHSWKNGHEDLAAEVEVLIGGVMQGLTRYRGTEARALQTALAVEKPAPPYRAALSRDTLHEM
jgi:hypothetical protein